MEKGNLRLFQRRLASQDHPVVETDIKIHSIKNTYFIICKIIKYVY